jgi:anti-sigma regulatory factor (Ser/Thr protein kinase)
MIFRETMRAPAEREQLAVIRSFVEQRAGKTPAGNEEIYDLVQAVDEAVTNIIIHGYHDGPGEIEVELAYQPGSITVSLRDRAPLFDPTATPEPDLTLPLHLRPIGGMGVSLMRKCVDELKYSPRPDMGNELRMVKYLQDFGGRE